MPLPVAVSVVSVAGFAIIFVILVQPLIFSDVHVAGSKGADVNAVFPEIFTLVTLVPTSAKAVSPVGKVGSVVSDVQPDKSRLKVPAGNPTIVVIPAPTIVNVVGRPLHPVRFSVVSAAGRVGKDNNAEQFVRFIDLADCGNPLPTLFNLVHPVRSMVANIVELEKNIDVNVEGSP